MTVPNQFANVTTTIPLSQLDANFNTPITLGNTAIQLGNTVTTLNNMTFANVTITSVSTPITAAQGGTGLSTLASNNVLLGNGTGTVQVVAPGSAGNVLTSTGTTWTSNAASSLAVTSFSAGTTGFTPNTATQGAVTLAGTLATTNGGTGLTSFTANGVLYASSTSALATGSAFTFNGSSAVISVNSSSDALRITQTGAGNALVVEDSTNPDATPFVVDANGRVVVGHTSALAATGGIPNIQYVGGAVPFGNFGFASTAAIGAFTFARSKSATIGTNAALVAGDQIGVFRFQGADGVSAYLDGAQIIAAADGSFSATSSPGRLVFSTTADGASSPTERMRIDAAGNVGIGTGTITGVTLRVNKNITGATSSFGVYAPPAIQSDVTTGVQVFGTFPSIVDSAFTLNSLNHFFASQGTKGASATLTNQYGFVASSTLTGATNNYGFYSNIASGTGRWNFYANGTAANFFTGNVLIGTATDRGGAFQVTGTSTTAAATTQRITGFAFDSRLRLSRANASETVVASGDSIGILAFDGYDGATYVPAAQILAAVDGTPGTNDMPGRLVFSTTADGASSPTERMRIDSAGNVGIGGIAAATTKLFLGGTQPSSSNITFVVTAGGTIPSTTTSTAQYFRSVPTTEAASFTLTNLQHYYAAQGTFGASSTVTSQFGFFADSMTGATNNYGFYSNIASGTGRWNFYANGTAENYLGGNLKIGGTAARATTAGTNQLVLFDGTAPVGTLANGVSFYSAAGEARVMDAAGNSTLLSPHDSATNEWIFHSKHTPTGKVLRIDVEKMLRFINDHFGLDMIQEFTEE